MDEVRIANQARKSLQLAETTTKVVTTINYENTGE
jgi:hypothetical protein